MVLHGNGKWVDWSDLGLKVIEEKADDEILRKLKIVHAYEARVLNVSCNNLGDEVEVILEGAEGENIRCFFTGCIKTEFNFWPSHPKCGPFSQSGCNIQWSFISKVTVTIEKEHFTATYYECKFDLFPLDVKLWCKNINFSRVFSDGTSMEV